MEGQVDLLAGQCRLENLEASITIVADRTGDGFIQRNGARDFVTLTRQTVDVAADCLAHLLRSEYDGLQGAPCERKSGPECDRYDFLHGETFILGI